MEKKKAPPKKAEPSKAEKAIKHALILLDPKGSGAPEPGSPGYMIDVFRTLREGL